MSMRPASHAISMPEAPAEPTWMRVFEPSRFLPLIVGVLLMFLMFRSYLVITRLETPQPL